MRASQFIKILLLLFYTSACANKNQQQISSDNSLSIPGTTLPANAFIADTLETGKVIAKVICKDDTTQSYALYIPAKGNKEALPAIYFFDPHGDGSLPLNKYQALADTYNFIFIGSNNSKNGNDWQTSENIWNTLFNDSQKRLKINHNRIYTVGFSGGAKVAGYVALNHAEIKGVIANGAGLPDATPADNFNFSFTAIAGEGDMNMTDLVSMSAGLDKTQTRHRIIFFDGKHEWAPAGTMNIAFTGLAFDAMRENLILVNNTFIATYIAINKKEIAHDLTLLNYVKAEKECRLSATMLEGLTNEVNWFNQKEDSLKANPVYIRQSEAEQKLFATEQNIKAAYMQQFEQVDVGYWAKTISGLQKKVNPHTAEGAMYQRLLAYLSLAFYSISNQLIKGNQDKEAAYFVELYKMADATNSEAWYFSAILNARNNNVQATEGDLLKAVQYGFTEKDRMMQQPEFQKAGIQMNIAKIVAKMK